MKAIQVTDKVFWVGVQNPDLRVFDVIMRTNWGTSYNSYLVKGSKKIAVIDAVKDAFGEEQIDRIKDVCDPAKIDYIICNHTEPDHSGSLTRLLDLAPGAKVVCSKSASIFLKDITNRDLNYIIAEDGLELDLGDVNLRFISAPFLHWPDSIFTYVESEQFLSTGDVFGFHFSAENLFDDLTPLTDDMIESQKYYYDVIMSPFAPYVLKAVDKIKGLRIKIIGPSHGPVLRTDPLEAVRRYREWSQPVKNDPKKVFIGYISCYGYTKQLAHQIYDAVIKAGLCAELADISDIGPGEAIEKINSADAFAIGSPTLNRDALKPAWDVLCGLCPFIVKGKKAVVFGSYGWSGEAARYMEQRLKNLDVQVVASATAKLKPNEAELAAATQAGTTLVKALE
ncbi:MAG: FprA family A-type flavoprotein [Eubacteriales bacterium]